MGLLLLSFPLPFNFNNLESSLKFRDLLLLKWLKKAIEKFQSCLASVCSVSSFYEIKLAIEDCCGLGRLLLGSHAREQALVRRSRVRRWPAWRFRPLLAVIAPRETKAASPCEPPTYSTLHY